jgi:predicted peptidase
MNPVRIVMFLTLVALCVPDAFAAKKEPNKKNGKPVSRVKFDREAKRLGLLPETIVIGGVERRYLVYVPKDYDRSKPLPLVLFLHGRGEGGDDGIKPATVGIYPAVQENPGRFPCILVMPQNPHGVWWHNAFDFVDRVMDAVRANYNIDPSRIYCTGISMGGFGVWSYASHHPDWFAALITCSSGGKADDATKVARIPAWIFHNTGDRIVSINMDKALVSSLREAGGTPNFTTYIDTEHDAWTKAFGDPETIAWLFAQRKM